MSRPLKNNADYFPHDRDMRNDPKIRALRAKFGNDGFAVWVYLLEALTDANNFEIGFSDLDVELLSADFSVEPELLKEIVAYMVRIGLIQMENSILFCQKHRERLAPLLESRDRKRAWAENNKRPEPQSKRVLGVQNPQSKVKESKVKESKVEIEKEKDAPANFTEPENKKIETATEAEALIFSWQNSAGAATIQHWYERRKKHFSQADFEQEVAKFCGHYLTTSDEGKSQRFKREPLLFFQNGFPKWLADSEQFSRQQKHAGPSGTYTPQSGYRPLAKSQINHFSDSPLRAKERQAF